LGITDVGDIVGVGSQKETLRTGTDTETPFTQCASRRVQNSTMLSGTWCAWCLLT